MYERTIFILKLGKFFVNVLREIVFRHCVGEFCICMFMKVMKADFFEIPQGDFRVFFMEKVYPSLIQSRDIRF